jgi:RNA recognition motif-containing protein
VLKKEHMKKMRDIARNNLYFKGFPNDTSVSREDLERELAEFFGKFGEVKNLKLPVREATVDGVPTEVLTGFGFCAFQNLEAAQKCRFDIQKELFRGVYKIYANPFEWKELRAAHKMERIDQLELQRFLQL